MIALCQAPFLMDDLNVDLLFPPDVIARAKRYLGYTSGGLGNWHCFSNIYQQWLNFYVIHRFSTYMFSFLMCSLGAYSDSRGLPGIRQEVADFLLRRDGYPRLIFLC